MLSEVLGSVDFVIFVSMFVLKMSVVDFEDLIRNVFMCFDDDSDGVINLDELKEVLMIMGMRFIE